MRIQVHPESLREVARTFNRQSAAIQEIEEELCRAIGGLDTWAWDGRSRARAEPLLGRVGPEGRNLAGQLEELGRKLQHVAEEFERTDAIVADPLTPVFEGLSQWTEQASAFFEQFENLKTWFAVPLVAGLMVPGMTYAGQIKLYGPQWLKEWAGISSHLTHIKASNIPKHMAKSALHIGPLDVLFEAGSELDENWKEYKGDLRKAAVGVAVDTAIGVGITTLAGAGGAYIGAVIGQILIPIPGAGALIGGTLGRIAGTWLGGQLAEKAENIRLGDQELDQWLVEFIAK